MVYWVRFSCALAVALAVLVAPLGAAGGPSPVQRPREVEQVEQAPPKPSPVPFDAEIHLIDHAIRKGDVAFEGRRYEEAEHVWSMALDSTRPREQIRARRTALVHRLVGVHIVLSRTTDSPQHLVDAHALVRARLLEYETNYQPSPTTAREREQLAARRAELVGYLQNAEGSRGYRRWYDHQMRDVLAEDRYLKRRYRGGRGMAIGGAVMLGGGGTFAASTYGLGEMPFALWVASAVTALAGAVLLPTGLAFHYSARKETRQRVDAKIEGYFAPHGRPDARPPKATASRVPMLLFGPLTLRF